MFYTLSNNESCDIKSNVAFIPGPNRAIGFFDQLAKKVQMIDTHLSVEQEAKIRQVISEIQQKCKNKHPWLYALQSILNPFSSAYKIERLLRTITSALNQKVIHTNYTCELAVEGSLGTIENNFLDNCKNKNFIGCEENGIFEHYEENELAEVCKHNDLLEDWKSFNGKDLIPRGQSELCLKFRMYNQSDELQSSTHGIFQFFLPVKLFENKKEGDSIFLQYKGKIVELKINQDTISSWKAQEPALFEEYFENTKKKSLMALKTGIFGEKGSQNLAIKSEYVSPYHLDHESQLYKYSRTTNSIELSNSKKIPEWEVFDKLNENEVYVKNFDDKIMIRFGMPGSQDKDLNIGFNCKCVFFSIESTSPIITDFGKKSAGYFFAFYRNISFPNYTSDQINEMIQKSKVSYLNGIFTITMPKP